MSKAIQELLRLAPAVALLVRQDEHGHTISEQELPTGLLHRGDLVKVLPGAAVPADGGVVDGKSHVDESMITGEAAPAAKRPQDAVIGGAIVPVLLVSLVPRCTVLSAPGTDIAVVWRAAHRLGVRRCQMGGGTAPGLFTDSLTFVISSITAMCHPPHVQAR